MPYDKLGDAPASLKGIEPAITLAQANEIARCADAIESDDVESPWAVCIDQFRTETHRVENGKWVRKGKKERKIEMINPEELVRRVRNAWRARFEKQSPAAILDMDSGFWPKEVLEDQIIIEAPTGLLSYSYTVNEDGEIEFGEAVKVEVTYQKTTEYFEVAIAPRATEADAGFVGREWDVTIIGESEKSPVVTIEGRQHILSQNGNLYPLHVLADSAPSWEGIKVFDNHLTDSEFKERAGMRSIAKEWVGNIVSPKWEADKRRLTGIFKVVERALAQKLKDAWDAETLETIGFSLDSFTNKETLTHEGQQFNVIEGFVKKFSVDLVAEPAAGGGFNRLIAAQQIVQEANEMTDEELRAMVGSVIADTLPGAVAEALAAKETQESEEATDEEVEEVETEAVEGASESEDEEAVEETQVSGQEASVDGQQALETVRRLECKILLRDKLDAAKLPGELRGVAEAQFSGKVFEEAELDGTIKRLKEAHVALDQSGQVQGAGGSRPVLTPGMDGRDVAEVEFLRLIAGNRAFKALEHSETDFVQERITESYRSWVKASRPNYGTRRMSQWVYNLLDGDPMADGRAYEAVTTSSMSSIVKNTLNLLLANDYAKRTRWWEPIVTTEEVDTIDDETLVRVYGLDTLSVVEAGGPYTDLNWVDEEETASHVKKGNVIPVHMETLLQDKLQIIRTIPRRLSTSWYNTISSLVSAVFTTNTATGPVLSDTGALFNATAVTTAGGHANLLTAALSFTSYGAARTAMMIQTDQYSGGETSVQGQRLLVQPKFMLVPVDLEATANRIRNSEMMPGSQDNDINPYYQQFVVVPVPNWTDPNNWALVGDKNEFPAIWLIFLRGRQVPELFTSDSETAGAMFTNDTLRYKVRMMAYRFSSTYDCAPVSDFRALHKSNV